MSVLISYICRLLNSLQCFDPGQSNVQHGQQPGREVGEHASALKPSSWIIHRVRKQTAANRGRPRINMAPKRSVFAGGRTRSQWFSAGAAITNGNEYISSEGLLEQQRNSRFRQLQMVQQRELLLNQQREELMEEQKLLEEQKRHLLSLEAEANVLSVLIAAYLVNFCQY